MELVIVLIQAICYFVALKVFNLNYRKVIYVIFGLVAGGTYSIWRMLNLGSYTLYGYFLILIFTIIAIDKSWKAKLRDLLSIIFLQLLLNQIVDLVIRGMKILNIAGVNELNYYTEYLINTTGTLFGWGIVWLVNKKKREKKPTIKNFKWISILNIILGICIMVVVSSIQIASDGYIQKNNFQRYQIIVWIISMLLLLALWVICGFSYIIQRENEKKETLLQQMAIMMETQKTYYKELLEKEEETRKFRHDIINHGIVIKEMLNAGNIDKTKEYVNKLQLDTRQYGVKGVKSGNQVIDILSKNLLSELPSKCNVQIIGNVGEIDEKVDQVLLNIVYANILKNAVEEIKRFDEKMNTELFVEFSHGKHMAEIKIKNTITEQGLKKEKWKNQGESIKVHSEGHGYGIQNAKEAILLMGGTLSFCIEDGYFSSIAAFKI